MEWSDSQIHQLFRCNLFHSTWCPSLSSIITLTKPTRQQLLELNKFYQKQYLCVHFDMPRWSCAFSFYSACIAVGDRTLQQTTKAEWRNNRPGVECPSKSLWHVLNLKFITFSTNWPYNILQQFSPLLKLHKLSFSNVNNLHKWSSWVWCFVLR